MAWKCIECWTHVQYPVHHRIGRLPTIVSRDQEWIRDGVCQHHLKGDPSLEREAPQEQMESCKAFLPRTTPQLRKRNNEYCLLLKRVRREGILEHLDQGCSVVVTRQRSFRRRVR
jgi:hypothetical protein